MNLTFRDAEADDIPIILEWSKATWLLHKDHYPDYFQDWEKVQSALKARFASDKVANLRPTMLIAELNGVPVGYISAIHSIVDLPEHRAEHLAHIDDIEVHFAYRRQGIGRALLQQITARLIENGVTKMRAVIWSFNDASLGLFSNEGVTPQFTGVSRRLAPPIDSPAKPRARKQRWWVSALQLILGIYLVLILIEQAQLLLR